LIIDLYLLSRKTSQAKRRGKKNKWQVRNICLAIFCHAFVINHSIFIFQFLKTINNAKHFFCHLFVTCCIAWINCIDCLNLIGILAALVLNMQLLLSFSPVDWDAHDNVAREKESKDAEEGEDAAEEVASAPRHRRRPTDLERHHQKSHLETELVSVSFYCVSIFYTEQAI
jgi:hypothetical protein